MQHHARTMRSAFHALTPYFPILGAIIALGSWWLSTVTADSAKRLEQGISAALDRFDADRRASNLERLLSNAEKQATRIELRSGPDSEVANRLARIEVHLGVPAATSGRSEREEDILRDFVSSGDRHYWTQVAWQDLDLVYWERTRMLRDLDDVTFSACPARLLSPAYERLQRVAGCIENAGSTGFETAPIVAQLRSVRLPETASSCLRDRAMHVYKEVGAIYDAFRDVRSALRSSQNTTNTLSVSITNPNFRQLEMATTQYLQINAIAQSCIAPEYLSLSNEVSSVRQSLIAYAREELLPRRKWEAKLVGIGAIVLYVVSAMLGIYGKWDELRSKRSSKNNI